jgi:dehydrogenase/reductase SDR family protein 12
LKTNQYFLKAAIEIAKRGGKIHMVCRNPTYAEEAKKEILEVAKISDSIHIHILDMSDPKAVYKFAREFDQPLTVLINNAGCMVNTRTETPDGFEKNFATNTLGTHILTETLIPHLQKSSDKARVVIVSSGGMLTHKLDLTDMQSEKMNTFDGTMAYAQNKRQQVIMTEQYAAKYPEIFFASMHPGKLTFLYDFWKVFYIDGV